MRDGDIARRTLLGLFAAAMMDRGRSAWAQPRARHKPAPHVIAIDPGHGGVDPGAISSRGIYEKDITLDTAHALARRLEATRRFRVVLTRHGDVYVPLRERVVRARAQHADLFLSIHADTLPDAELRGLSVYTLSEAASDRETAALASRENRDDFAARLKLARRPPVIGNILLDLARREISNRSLLLAHDVVEQMVHMVPLLEKPQRAAGFAVLTAPDMPSALVELGCLSNREEERLLEQSAYRARLAFGLMQAIEAYFAAGAGSA
jgi:N-acetylmuramoyl-L-alanine amidase